MRGWNSAVYLFISYFRFRRRSRRTRLRRPDGVVEYRHSPMRSSVRKGRGAYSSVRARRYRRRPRSRLRLFQGPHRRRADADPSDSPIDRHRRTRRCWRPMRRIISRTPGRARSYVEAHLHRSLPREAVAISVNSMVRRSQDQLHFHVDCVDNDVATTLAEYKDRLDSQWRPMSVALEGRHYWARRLDSPDLSDISPFRLLADGVDGAKDRMGLWTLVAIGATFAGGQPGFILLADDAETGGGHGQDLQDRECAIATVK